MATSSTTTIWPTIWSNCSQLYIDDWFDGTPAANTTAGYINGLFTSQCLENIPTRTWTNASVCGDGVRNGNEQCDCGINDCSVVDPCCNGATCMLISNATCSTIDPCCDNCGIVTDSRVCRPSANAYCDVAETCNGVNATCPPDITVRPGSSCSWNVSGHQGTGVCYGNACLSHDEQCWQQYPAVVNILGDIDYSGQCFVQSMSCHHVINQPASHHAVRAALLYCLS
jgi:hypothetical protein